MRIAVIDDDPVESILLSELAKEIGENFIFEAFSTLESFLEAQPEAYAIAFLDRRIPPHEEFSDSLPVLAQTAFRGRLILMTAHDPGVDLQRFDFEIVGPIEKIALLETEVLAGVLKP